MIYCLLFIFLVCWVKLSKTYTSKVFGMADVNCLLNLVNNIMCATAQINSYYSPHLFVLQNKSVAWIYMECGVYCTGPCTVCRLHQNIFWSPVHLTSVILWIITFCLEKLISKGDLAVYFFIPRQGKLKGDIGMLRSICPSVCPSPPQLISTTH